MTRLSIRWRLTLWYGAALAAILMIFSGATYWRYRAAATAAFDADLVNNLDVLQGELVEELAEAKAEAEGKAGDHADVERSAANSTLENFRLNAMYAEIRRGSRAETILARLPGGGVAVGREIVGQSAWSDLSSAPPATRVVSAGPRVRAAIRAFQPPGDAQPMFLVVAEQTTLVDQTLGSIRRSLIDFGAVGLLLALAGGYWLATRALRPIDLMTTQAQDMAGLGSREGLRRLDVPNPGDELGRLALTFNRLLERIESSVTQMKDFVADAAHELKTPVSIVRTEAELSLSANRGVEEYRESLGAIARESEQLSNLVRDLTLLAEGETLEHPLERRLVDLNELIHEVVRSLRGLAAQRRVSVAMEPSGGVEYRGDERLLRQTFTNLVENAIKFSREGGRVGICVQEAGGVVEVRVLDEAPTLPQSDRERVFERFYRAQQSRSGDAAGSGLGLAIVRWAVGLHGGHVRVEEGDGSGNVFVVVLPTLPEDWDRGGEPVIVATKRVSGHAVGITLLLLSCAAAAGAQAPAPVTIEEAIQAAHAANSRLPLSSVEVSVADARRTEALAEKWLKVAVEGDFYYAPAAGYDPILTNLGDARLQAVVRQPLYAGGRLKAGVERADADVAAAHARYRIAEKDLDLEIRSRYAEWLAAEAEVAARREGIDRLSKYRTSLGSRQASGQGVATDVLRIDVRLALEEAAATQAEERQDEARLVLNERMGRDPEAPLSLAPLPAPQPSAPLEGAAWDAAPEVAAAEADARSAQASVTIAKSDLLPHLFLNGDLGFWVSDTTTLSSQFWDRLWAAKGYSVALTLAWPVWDTGAAKARVAEANLGLKEARLRVEAERRDARLVYTQARAALRSLYRQIEILSRALPGAQDSYLAAESRYRGGIATSLEVLDAYSAAVDAAVRLGEVTARYRVAQAVARRWSEP